jgi:hypothetical protein
VTYKNIEDERAYDREWKRRKRQSDPEFRELCYARARASHAKNKGARSEQKKEYWKINKETLKVVKKARHQERRKRFVGWDSELLALVMKEARELCKSRKEATGIDWSIDHDIPLKGKNISGLHVWNNVRVIPKLQNHQKYNNYETDWD